MRTLKYAILGLLCRGELTGYDIAKAFEKGLGNFWSAGHSQIYPELKKLTAEGLVQFATVSNGEMEKKLYTITEVGVKDFQQWILLDEPLEPTSKDTFKLRVYLSDSISDEKLRQHLESQKKMREKRLSILECTMAEEYANIDFAVLDKVRRGDYLVLKGAILRERAYVEWLRESLQLMSSDKII